MFYDALFLEKATRARKRWFFFFKIGVIVDNFHCTDRVISIRWNLLQSIKSTDVRTENGKLLKTNRSLMFAVNMDLKVFRIPSFRFSGDFPSFHHFSIFTVPYAAGNYKLK